MIRWLLGLLVAWMGVASRRMNYFRFPLLPRNRLGLSELAMRLISRFATWMLIAWLSFVGHTWAAEMPPLEFKGIRLGADKSALESFGVPFDCKSPTLCIATTSGAVSECFRTRAPNCSHEMQELLTFGDADVLSYIVSVREGKITAVSILIQSPQFTGLIDALAAKYGKPMEDRITRVQTKLGASFDSRLVTWKRADGEIRGEEYWGDMEHAMVSMTLNPEEAAASTDRKERASKAASKL